jgi:hypothetical protein
MLIKILIKIVKTSLLIFALTFISFAFTNLNAKTNSGAIFLEIEPSAKAAAMGDTGVGMYSDIGSSEKNPANLCWTSNQSLLISHNEYLENIHMEYLGYSKRISRTFTIGISGKYLYMNDLIKRDEYGDEFGTFGAQNSAYSLTLSKILGENVAIGAAGKIVKEQIDNYSDQVLSGDFGIIFSNSINKIIYSDSVSRYKKNYGAAYLDQKNHWSFGFAVRNLGGNIRVYKEAFKLPTVYSFGSGFFFKNMKLAFDIDRNTDDETIYKTGMEYYVIDLLNLRAGYIYRGKNYDNLGVTYGFGLKLFDTLFLDYAYVPFNDLGDTHRFSLRYEF